MNDVQVKSAELFRWRVLALCATAVFLAISIGYSYARAPWWDEGVFADVSVTFAQHGHLGNQLLAPEGYRDFPQVDRYTYWQFPLYLLSLGFWFRALPQTVECMRLFSVLWGCVYLYAWFLLIRGLSDDEALALFVMSVLAMEYSFLSAASDGRMDMMCCALGMAALASFVCLRKKSWARAVIMAGCFGAASLFCHPMGALMNFMLASVIVLNSHTFRWKPVAIATLPYIGGILLYGLYILQAPSVFLAQTKGNTGYRITSGWGLLRNLLNDFSTRYLGYYLTGLVGLNKLKVASLIFALIGVAGVAFTRQLRLSAVGKTLLALSAIGYCGVALIDNQKIPGYFMYSLPFMVACGGVWIYYCWRAGGRKRLAIALLPLTALVGAGGFLYKIHQNEYKSLYTPVIAAIKSNTKPTEIVMGGAELAFGLGFTDRLIDDRFLGHKSGITPQIYVVNPYYGLSGPAGEFAQNKLRTSYHLIFTNQMYAVYLRNAAAHN